MKRVCVLTPGHLATNPRVVKEATALSDAGFDVTVVHGDYLPRARVVDAALYDPRWTIRTVPFGPAQRSRLNYIAQTLRRRGARICARLNLNLNSSAPIAHAPAVPGLAAAACTVPADLYVAHYVAALPAAAGAARRHRALYAFDAEDFHLGDLPDSPKHAFEKSLIRAIEAKVLPGAACITADSAGVADAYAAEYAIARPTIVLNTFPKDQAPDGPTPRGRVVPGPTLYWFSQTIGPNRGLECALAAIREARTAPHLHLRGTPAKGYDAALRQLAVALGVADRLHIHPPDVPDEMARLAHTFDVGFSGEPGFSRNNTLSLGNKVFTYLLAGVPAVMSDVPAHVSFAAEAEGATFLFRAEDPTSLANALDALFENPDRLANARARAFALGQERFNWETESATLLACVSRALSATEHRTA